MRFHFQSVFIVALLALVVSAQTADSIQIDDPRPLKAAIDKLENMLGIPINYEDPRFASAEDVEDVTDKVQNSQQRAAHPNVRILVPKGGVLGVSGVASVSAKPSLGGATALLTTLHAQHEGNGYPGRFSIQSISSTATVTPASVRSSDGAWKTAAPAMDSRLTLPYQQRTAADALALLAKNLSQAVGIQVGVGRFPMVAFANATVSLGAENEPAGIVIVRLFEQVSAQYSKTSASQSVYSYRLLYDPGMKLYFLHVNAVEPVASPVATEPAPPPPPKGFLITVPNKK